MNLISKSKELVNTQRGFTLIELMISITIGLIVLAAVLGMFVSMIKSDSDNLKAIRLNQDLRATMSLIIRDMRRAGADALAVTRGAGPYPFSNATTRMIVSPNQQADANACITFAYDEDEDGNDDGNSERFGYRWDSSEGAVEARQDGALCSAGGWGNITDNKLVQITGLSFNETTVQEGSIFIRQIEVTLSGRLQKDPTVTRQLIETVKIRNGDTGP